MTNVIHDEKLLLSLGEFCVDYFRDSLGLELEKEAYGPSLNEGICYEKCFRFDFEGTVSGTVFACMEGYTVLMLIPRIIKYLNHHSFHLLSSDDYLAEFFNRFIKKVSTEIEEHKVHIHSSKCQDMSHKMISIDLEKLRQHILVFFMRDIKEENYYGRMHLIVTIEKYDSKQEKETKKPLLSRLMKSISLM